MKIKNNKRNRIILISAVSIAVLLAVGGAGGYMWKVRDTDQKWGDVIYPGVNVADIDLSGKTKEEAINLIKEKYNDALLKKKISITAGQKSYSIDYSKLNAHYDIESVVNEAFDYGKDKSTVEKYNLIKNAPLKKYELTFTYDDKYIGQILTTMEKDINKEPVNAKLEVVARGNFKVSQDQKGYKIDREKLEADIKSKINGNLDEEVAIQAPIQEVQASITADKLKSIDTQISSYSTSFATSSPERASNIQLAAKSINGKILMPGDTFSFNETVGQRTTARGYKMAPVIINSQVSADLGGGICQVSSTLYNALLRTELSYSAMDRIAHSLPSSYVPKGLDATVDWGNIDFKFKNTLDYPIFIEGTTENKNVYFNIYSNSSYKDRTYTLLSDVYETVPTTTKTVEDPTLPEGQKVTDKKPYTGYRVRVTKQTFEKGNLVKSEVLYSDYYRPVTGVDKIGTKKGETASN